MKQWTKPDIAILDIDATESGKHTNKYEGIDGVDATGEYNKYINKHGTGTFTPDGSDPDTDLHS